MFVYTYHIGHTFIIIYTYILISYFKEYATLFSLFVNLFIIKYFEDCINERTNQFSISQETIQVILVFFVKYNLKYILFALKVYYINFY